MNIMRRYIFQTMPNKIQGLHNDHIYDGLSHEQRQLHRMHNVIKGIHVDAWVKVKQVTKGDR